MAEIIEPIENYGLSADSKPKSLFSKIGIIGAGEVGRSIARMISTHGMDVVFIEVNQERIDRSIKELDAELDRMILRWGMTTGDKRAIMSRITGTTDYGMLEGCGLVIEAIKSRRRRDVEVITERKEIFRKIEAVVTKDAIITTNSSTLVITELSSELEYPERCASIHFTSSADSKVMEVVRSVHTGDACFEKIGIIAGLLEKTLVEVQESPGIISTRLLVPLINEAAHVLMEGVSTMEEIDLTMRIGFGLSQGPFAMADKIGLDKFVRWCENLYAEFGDTRYVASPLIKRLVRHNRTGYKVRAGFYDYDADGNRVAQNHRSFDYIKMR